MWSGQSHNRHSRPNPKFGDYARKPKGFGTPFGKTNFGSTQAKNIFSDNQQTALTKRTSTSGFSRFVSGLPELKKVKLTSVFGRELTLKANALTRHFGHFGGILEATN